MPIQVQVVVEVSVSCDGVSSALSIDLERDPITVAGAIPGGVLNFFANSKGANPPAAIASLGYPYALELSGRKVTVTWPSPPPAGVTAVAFYLLF